MTGRPFDPQTLARYEFIAEQHGETMAASLAPNGCFFIFIQSVDGHEASFYTNMVESDVRRACRALIKQLKAGTAIKLRSAAGGPTQGST